jgi:hypothetical protein
MDPVHKREEKWEGIPFGSVEDLADLIEEFVDLVVKGAAEGIEPAVVAIRYPDKEYSRMFLTDLRELLPVLTLDEADFFIAVEPSGHPKSVAIECTVFGNREFRWSISLDVTGRNEVAVNGAFVAAKERIEKLYERKRHAEELAAAAETEAVAPGPEPESRWHKIAYNPYTVGAVVGLFLLAVGFVAGKVF